MDMTEKFLELKKQKNAVLLAHYYQEEDIQDIADYIGDSLDLARVAQKTEADIILFSGVHFMAEGAKILNPSKKVIIPDMRAGCSLSDSCPPASFAKFKEAHPEHKVISYINCSAEIKALSDVICTSTNASKIIERAKKEWGENTQFIFGPDRNLGSYLAKQTQTNLLIWQGSCIVHETFSERKLVDLVTIHPDAHVIAHPECEESLLRKAHFVGSTSALLNYTIQNSAKKFIVLTEEGILHQMRKKSPQKEFIPAPPNNENCHCNECPFMKLNTIEKLFHVLSTETNEIIVPEHLAEKALLPLRRMLDWS